MIQLSHLDLFNPEGLSWANGQCATHGDFRVLRPKAACSAVTCPHCAHAEFEKQQLLDQHNARIRHLFANSDIPKKYQSATIKCYGTEQYPGQAEAKAAVIQYLRDFGSKHRPRGEGLLLIGEHGTGKTHLACALISNLCGKGFGVRYTTARDLMDFLLKGMQSDTCTYAGQVLRCAEWDLLVIDEIDTITGEKEANRLGQVLDRRYRDGKPTLAISNTPLDELHHRISKRSVERLIDGARIVEFTWPGQRSTA